MDTLANTLSKINNSNKVLKTSIIVKNSKFIREILKLFQNYDYVKEIELIEDNKQGMLNIELKNNLNECKVIKPRLSIKHNEIQDIEKKYLPAKDFGILIISTSKGLMTQFEAKKNNIGGTLIAYCY